MNFTLPNYRLKACEMTAQGNALGDSTPFILCPEGALPKPQPAMVLPFQGMSVFGFGSQGVALGCHVVALSARQIQC
jgi:hypothetical protein